MQGTFLKESIGRDLEAMGTHEALNQASNKVTNLLLTTFGLLLYHMQGTLPDFAGATNSSNTALRPQSLQQINDALVSRTVSASTSHTVVPCGRQLPHFLRVLISDGNNTHGLMRCVSHGLPIMLAFITCLRMSTCVPVAQCQVRDVYEHVRESREKFLAAHPGLASRAPAAPTPAPRPLPADTKSARTLNRALSSKSSFKCASYIL